MEGFVDPGDVTNFDRMYAIMAAYAGPLPEAKLRLQSTHGQSIRFDYAQTPTSSSTAK
jgi:hypothetical protein